MAPQHFDLQEVTQGIWAAVGDLAGTSVGNAAIIDLGGKTIVVDTFMSDVAAAELRETARALTGQDAYLAVNSHWHNDHTYGNQAFADVPIVSTALTRDRLAAVSTDEDIAQWEAEIESALEGVREQAATGDEGAKRRLETLTHFSRFAGGFRLTLPNLLIDSRLVVQGERSAEIITHGRGHTVSDTIVWVPDAGVLVTGDLCWNRIHPRTRDGFPADWASYAETLLALEPTHVVPGHGVAAGVEALEPVPAYFRELEDLVNAVTDGADPNDLDPPTGSEDWAGIQRFRSGITLLAKR